MITLAQIKAARALLGWTQETLADAAKISRPSINNVERGLYSPRPETYQAIVGAFEKAGVEFTPNNGLRLRQEDHNITTYTGPDFVRDLDLDILSVLQGPDDEIIGVSCDEKKWMEYGSVSNQIYIEARLKRKWTERLLIPENAQFITSPGSSYRMLPSSHFGKTTYEVYGNRLALIEWEAMRVTQIKNSTLTDMFKKQFQALWDIAKPISSKQLKKMEQLKTASTIRKA
jgi:transcriptional regulator with XRE-family HTH domain